MSDETDLEPGVSFRLVRFNPRRIRLGCSGAAEVEIADQDNVVWLWMTRRDVERNIALYGRHRELVDALESYRAGREIVTPPAGDRLADPGGV